MCNIVNYGLNTIAPKKEHAFTGAYKNKCPHIPLPKLYICIAPVVL